MSVALAEIIVPREVMEIAAQSIGAFFEPICKVDRWRQRHPIHWLNPDYLLRPIWLTVGTWCGT
jgi:hypothetical protein